ncbi:MAG: hypothetical protein WCN95_06135 [bacterium]
MKIFLPLVAIMVTALFGGCGGDSTNPIVGKWSPPVGVIMTFYDDGTCFGVMADHHQWSTSDGLLSISGPGVQTFTFPYSVSGDTMTLTTSNGQVLQFSRVIEDSNTSGGGDTGGDGGVVTQSKWNQITSGISYSQAIAILGNEASHKGTPDNGSYYWFSAGDNWVNISFHASRASGKSVSPSGDITGEFQARWNSSTGQYDY